MDPAGLTTFCQEHIDRNILSRRLCVEVAILCALGAIYDLPFRHWWYAIAFTVNLTMVWLNIGYFLFLHRNLKKLRRLQKAAIQLLKAETDGQIEVGFDQTFAAFNELLADYEAQKTQ